MVLKTRFQLIRTVAVIGWVGPALLLAACGDGDGRSCLPLEDTYCQEGVVYRVNSCGELEEVLEHCHCGCSPDHTVCIADCGSFCDKDGNCENREDCWSCPEDCGCDDGLVCSRITRSCQDCSDDCGSRECGPVPNGCGESCGHGCDGLPIAGGAPVPTCAPPKVSAFASPRPTRIFAVDSTRIAAM
jgi:hypothetical protein